MKRPVTDLPLPNRCLFASAAEHLALAYLLRRQIATYRTYRSDLFTCTHPDTTTAKHQLQVRVASTYSSERGREILLSGEQTDYEYLIVVHLNVGFFSTKDRPTSEGLNAPDILVLPTAFVRMNAVRRKGSADLRLRVDQLPLGTYAGDEGIEQIASALGIPYPVSFAMLARKRNPPSRLPTRRK